MEQEMISIIIPTYNEEKGIGRTLEAILRLTSGRTDAEIIVSDAGNDRTAEIASALPVTLCRSEKGRAIQMNRGAAASAGSIFYFLHADTIPPSSFLDDILDTVRSGHQAGCFRMKFDDPDPIMDFYGWCTRLPFPICRGGDQSLFITRELFGRTGGFDESMQVMEDIDIIARIERYAPFHILDPHVTTSSRKYHANGKIRLQALFGMIHLMYACGYDQHDLIQFYRNNIV
jgi:rSAM/selenodomain-associated transferase 2